MPSRAPSPFVPRIRRSRVRGIPPLFLLSAVNCPLLTFLSERGEPKDPSSNLQDPNNLTFPLDL